MSESEDFAAIAARLKEIEEEKAAERRRQAEEQEKKDAA